MTLFSLIDPFAEVKYELTDLEKMKRQAEDLGASRFSEVGENGMPVAFITRRENGEWERVEVKKQEEVLQGRERAQGVASTATEEKKGGELRNFDDVRAALDSAKTMDELRAVNDRVEALYVADAAFGDEPSLAMRDEDWVEMTKFMKARADVLQGVEEKPPFKLHGQAVSSIRYAARNINLEDTADKSQVVVDLKFMHQRRVVSSMKDVSFGLAGAIIGEANQAALAEMIDNGIQTDGTATGTLGKKKLAYHEHSIKVEKGFAFWDRMTPEEQRQWFSNDWTEAHYMDMWRDAAKSQQRQLLETNMIVRGTELSQEAAIEQVAGEIKSKEYKFMGHQEEVQVFQGAVFLKDGRRLEYEFNAPEGATETVIEAEAAKAAAQAVALDKEDLSHAEFYEKEKLAREQRMNNQPAPPPVQAGKEEKGVLPDDVNTAVPENVTHRFLRVNEKFYFPDEKLAFTDMTDRLKAHEEHHEVVNALVDIAIARGWESVTVKGTDEFRKAVWLRAAACDIEVAGYKPSAVDLAQLAKEREKLGKGGEKAKDGAENEVIKGIAREQAANDVLQEGEQVTRKDAKVLRQVEGVLLEHGAAHYNFDPEERMNYYVKVRTDKGDKTIWGVDLERAMAEANPDLLEKLKLEFLGKQQVKVQVNERDKSGKVTGTHWDTKDRNEWRVSRAEAFMTQERDEAVAKHPELAPAYGTLAVAEKFAQQNLKPGDRERFVKKVQENLAQRMEAGQEVPVPLVRAQQQEQEKKRVRSRGKDADQGRSLEASR